MAWLICLSYGSNGPVSKVVNHRANGKRQEEAPNAETNNPSDTGSPVLGMYAGAGHERHLETQRGKI